MIRILLFSIRHWAFIAGCIGLSLFSTAQAVPSTINYQGRLTDNSPQQNPVNSTANMTFEIWDVAIGGTASPDRLWVEPASGATPVPVTGGIFNVRLGASAGASSVPIPATVFSGGTTRYLQIIVNGETLTPRQTISATGYANQAQNAALAANATNATTATNATQLGGVAAGGWQKANSPASCPAGQFYSAIAQNGTATCTSPPGNAGSVPTMQVFDSSGTFIVPAGITKIMVEAWGGGGNGYSDSTYRSCIYAGGGGGGYGRQTFTVSSGNSYSVTVGGSSQSSSFGALLTASGGTDATIGTACGSTPGTGGISTALFNINGSDGHYAEGGGAGAVGGVGGRPVACPADSCYLTGCPGVVPGGGGAGGLSSVDCSSAAGIGAHGRVVVYY